MLKQRVATGVVLVLLLIPLLLLSEKPFVLPLAVAIISAFAVYEVLLATKYVETKGIMIISLAFAAIIPFIQSINIVSFITALFLLTILLFLMLMKNGNIYSFEHISVVYLVSLMIPFFFSTLIYIRKMDLGNIYIYLVFIGAFMSDVGGYFVGRFFGKTKLAPNVSPKKTVEGSVGCIIVTILSFLLFAFILSHIYDKFEVNYVAYIICAVLTSVFSQIGDMSASIIKRKFGIKDFGSLMPGHGGMLDRFDSVMFASPFLYIYLSHFNIFNLH